MALWAFRRNTPDGCAGSAFSGVVCQRTRSAPVSLVNDSVCRLPRPDHEPSGRHSTLCFAGACGAWGDHGSLLVVPAGGERLGMLLAGAFQIRGIGEKEL